MEAAKIKVKTGKRTTVEDYKEIEYDISFTQIYACFNDVAHKIKSVTSFKLLFWLLSNRTNKGNGMECGTRSFNDFNNFLMDKCPDCTVSEQTYYSCLKELSEAGIIKKHSRNNYMANIFVIWKDDKEKRVAMIKHNSNTGEDIFLNPAQPNIIKIEEKQPPLTNEQ